MDGISAMVKTDVLSSVLRLLRFKANVFFHSSYCGGWSVDTSGSGRSTFHLIADGMGWLHMQQLDKPLALQKGDLVVFPRDAKHTISDYQQLNQLDTARQQTSSANATHSTQCQTNQEPTALICGYFDFDEPQRNPIMNALPEMVVVHGQNHQIEPWLATLITMIKTETDHHATGADVMVDKLSEILFIYVIRHYINDASPAKGLLAALSDIKISTALDAVHNHPAKPWTVATLAQQASMSRAAFAKRFSMVMDQSPMHYVSHWRMQLAHTELRESKKTVTEIAELVGYHNEVSFRKAFKQVTGISPGQVRKMGHV